MKTFIRLYSDKKKEINKFLEKFYQRKETATSLLIWQKNYENPVEMAELIRCVY